MEGYVKMTLLVSSYTTYYVYLHHPRRAPEALFPAAFPYTTVIPYRQLLLALCAPTLTWASCLRTHCKAFPGSPDWPSDQDWSQLNKEVDNRLLMPEFPGGVCHKSQPNYNEDQCIKTSEDWKTFEFHAGDPVSVMWDHFTNYTCLPDTQYSCSGQGYPSYVVNVTTAEHVKAAIDFGKNAPPRVLENP